MGGMDKNTEVDASDSQPYRLEWLESQKEMEEFRWGYYLNIWKEGLQKGILLSVVRDEFDHNWWRQNF